MKVGFVLNDLNLGGVEKITLKLVSGLINEGCQVVLYLFIPNGELLDQIPEGCVVKSPNQTFSYFSKWKWLIDQINLANLDGFITSSGKIGLQLYFFNGFKPLNSTWVSIQHVPIILPDGGRFKNFLRSFFARKYYKLVDYAVGVSEEIKREIIDLIGETGNVRRIYNPVISDDIKKYSGFNKGQIAPVYRYIVAVGRLDFQKNYDLMFDAFQTFLINQNIQEDYRLLIIGEGPLRDKLIKMVQKRGLKDRVNFLGFLSNPFPYIKSADALIMTSRWEGLPTAIIEALTLGIQVISTDCPTGPKELLHNGDYGFLCPVNDVHCITESLSKVYNGERKSITEGFLSQFYIEASTKEYMKLIS